MLRWLLSLLLSVIALRLLARRIPRRGPAPRPFDPTPAPDRERTRGAGALSPHEIDDADYEELPRG